MRVYIAGPMTGHKNLNFPAFERAAKSLRHRGHVVVSPHEDDASDLSWGALLSQDVAIIACSGVEAVVVLPGWETSRGARLETFVAMLCRMPVLAYGRKLTEIPYSEVSYLHTLAFYKEAKAA